MKKILIVSLVASALLTGCTGGQKTASTLTESGLNPENFNTEVNGAQTQLFVLKNKNNMEVCVTNFGGRIVSVMVPDRDGVLRDVVLGFRFHPRLCEIPL